MSSPSFDILTGRTEKHIHWFSNDIGIHQGAVAAFLAMQKAAKEDNILLSIASGFRNYQRQLSIWNRKFSGELAVKNEANEVIDISFLSPENIIKAICLYSAIPGTSRHHWGTDIDVFAENLLPKQTKLQLEPWEYTKNGYFYSLSVWLKENANRYGFYLPYDDYKGGVAAEPWHISFAPIANEYQQKFDLTTMVKNIEQSNILGKEILLANAENFFNSHINSVEQSDCNEVRFD